MRLIRVKSFFFFTHCINRFSLSKKIHAKHWTDSIEIGMVDVYGLKLYITSPNFSHAKKIFCGKSQAINRQDDRTQPDIRLV